MTLFGEALITRTKFLPPRSRRALLVRPRLDRRLVEANGLALLAVVAGTGYGKSSLVAEYVARTGTPALWYELSERDADAQLLALHLAHLCHRAFPGAADRALGLLASPGGAAKHGLAAMEAIADALLDRLEADTWLVLDDFHLLHGSEAIALVDHLLQHAPPRLHLVLASRQRPELPSFARLSLAGDAAVVDQSDLAFDRDEAAALLDLVGAACSAERLERLMNETEGWPMALQLAARHLLSDPHSAIATGGSRRDLFDYMARELLVTLTDDEREFVLATAPLARLEPTVCADLAGAPDSAARLRALNERGLFLIPLEQGSYRHHHLFREFLLDRLAEQGRLAEAHRAAARVWLARGDTEEALEHLLTAGDRDVAAELLAQLAPQLVDQGRYGRLSHWLGLLPAELLERAPALAVCQGDACRLASRYDEAIAWYERAERAYADSPAGRSRALAGKALVYLDTVRPAQAEALLEAAIAVSPEGRARAELLVLLAENKLNAGDARAAEALFAEARAELPESAEHQARVYLRTGRLDAARRALTAAPEPGAPRAHREAALVLALIEALCGAPERAREWAQAGLARARRQGSPSTEAIALMRLGHAALLAGEAEAGAHYEAALALAAAVGVPRLEAEPRLGLALCAARSGQLDAAQAQVDQALALTRATGDAWLAAMLELALGGALAASGDPRAEARLRAAKEAYAACGDPFGVALATLGLARLALALGEHKVLQAQMRELVPLLARHGHGFVLERPTLLGFESAEALGAFRARAVAAGVPEQLLDAEAPARAELLRIRTLGAFRVTRGQAVLSDKDFGREKARQLLHVLAAHPDGWLPKERLIDLLWPEADPQSVDGTFRVALNALQKALEPDRPSGQPGRYVLKQGTSYRLAEDAWLDAREFERLLAAAEAFEDEAAVPLYREALALYEGPFLAELPQYDAWCERVRDRLAGLFRAGACRFARLILERDPVEAAQWAERVLAAEPCAEEAARVLMTAQARAGDRALAIRTYDRLVVALDEELDVDPTPETQALYRRLVDDEAVTSL